MGGLSLLAAAAVLCASGCGVSLRAAELTLVIHDSGISFARTADAALVAGGETVLRIRNESATAARVVLVRSRKDPQDLPDSIRDENLRVAGDRVLASTSELEAQEATFASGGLGYKVETGSLHVYLDPDEVYLLLDAQSPPDAARYLRLTPTGDDQT